VNQKEAALGCCSASDIEFMMQNVALSCKRDIGGAHSRILFLFYFNFIIHFVKFSFKHL